MRCRRCTAALDLTSLSFRSLMVTVVSSLRIIRIDPRDEALSFEHEDHERITHVLTFVLFFGGKAHIESFPSQHRHRQRTPLAKVWIRVFLQNTLAIPKFATPSK
ncbi:hypothetical protein BC827DRAFT_719425 [Russula dissimulans]|nr:hypothetical protein BC827DRAFT_719425 [Russula dissimulans]